MKTPTQDLKVYEKPVVEIVLFTLEEGIAESLLSGENLICIEEME